MKPLAAFLYRNLLHSLSYKSSFVFETAAMIFQMVIFFYVAKLVPVEKLTSYAISGTQYFPYVLLGLTFSLYQSTALRGFATAIAAEQQAGTLEIVLLAVPMRTLLLAGLLWDFLFTTVRILLYLTVAFLFFDFPLYSLDLASLAVAILATLGSLAGFGLFSAGFLLLHKQGDPVIFFMNGASKILCSVFFPAAMFPGWLQKFSMLFPLTHALHLFRGIFMEARTMGQIVPDLMWLTALSFIFLPAGWLYFKYAYKKTRLEGSLSFR